MTAGQTSSFELLEKVQPGGCLFYDVVNMGGPSKGRIRDGYHRLLRHLGSQHTQLHVQEHNKKIK